MSKAARKQQRKKRKTHKVYQPQRQPQEQSRLWALNWDNLLLVLVAAVVALPALVAPYGRGGGYTPDLHIVSWLQVGTLAVLMLWVLAHIRRGFPRIPYFQSPVVLPLSLLILWGMLSGFWAVSAYEYMMDAIEWISAWLGGLLILLTVKNTRNIAFVMSAIAIAGFFMALLGAGQYLFDVKIIEQVVPPAGTLANKNMFAQYLLAVFPIALVLMIWSRNIALSLFYGIAAGLTATVIMYTGAKGSLVALYAVFVLFFLFWGYARFKRGYKPFAPWRAKVTLAIALMTGAGGQFLSPEMFLDTGPVTQLEMETQLAQKEMLREAAELTEEQRRQREESIREEMKAKRDAAIRHVKEKQGRVPKLPETYTPKDRGSLRGMIDFFINWIEGILPRGYAKSGVIRATMWVNSIPIFLERPWTGIGLGNWTNKYWLYQSWWRPDYKLWAGKYHANAHNDYVEIVCELGIIGTIFFLWAIIGLLRMVWRIFGRHFDERIAPLMAGPLLSLFAFSVCMLFSFPLKQPLTMFLCITYFALLSVGYVSTGNPPAPPVTPRTKDNGTSLKRIVVPGITAAVTAIFFLTSLWWQHRMYQSELHYRQASALLKQRKFKEAERMALEAYKMVPFRSALLWVRASALMSIGRAQDAIPMFEEVLRSKPFSTSTLHNLAVLYAEQERPSRAADVLHDLVNTQQSLRMHELYGYYLYKAQRWQEALDQIDVLVDQYIYRSDDLERRIARKGASPSEYVTFIDEYEDMARKYVLVMQRKGIIEKILANDGKIPPELMQKEQ